VFSKSRIFKFLKRDCGTIPVAEIISGNPYLYKHKSERHDFLPRFLFIETTKTEKNKKRHVYLLMVTLRLFYAPVNLTIFNFFHLLHCLQT
jgi:hypothetical protein